MTRAGFAAELYLPRGGTDDFDAVSERARAAADAMAREGVPIRYRGSVLLTEDETCFCFFDAASAAVVREASERADVEFDRVLPAKADGWERHRSRAAASPRTRPEDVSEGGG